MRTPPLGFSRRLKAFDKNLRVRWSYERRKWILEGKAKDRRGLMKPIRFIQAAPGVFEERRIPELSDRYIQYHDCHYPIMYTSHLDERLWHELYRMDARRYRNEKELMYAPQKREDEAEARALAQKADRAAYEAGEIYDYVSNRGSRAFPDGRL